MAIKYINQNACSSDLWVFLSWNIKAEDHKNRIKKNILIKKIKISYEVSSVVWKPF